MSQGRRSSSKRRAHACPSHHEPPLEQMAGRAGAGVDERSEAPMPLPHRPRKGVGVAGSGRDQRGWAIADGEQAD